MKYKSISKPSFIFVVTISLFLLTNNVFATVGGPTTIDRLSYNSKENSLYYVINDGSGKGCPPVIEKLNVNTKERTQVKSCDEIALTYYNDKNSATAYDKLIEDTFTNPNQKTLSIINLNDNNISIVTEYTGENKLNVDDFTFYKDFKATIFQNNEKKGEIDFVGCYKDQPNVFKGFIIPEKNKMALQISRAGNCYELGYAKDDVYVIDNINFKDTDSAYYSNFSEVKVQRGNIVGVAQNNKEINNTTASKTVGINSPTLVIWILILIIGLIIGFLFGNKSNNKSS